MFNRSTIELNLCRTSVNCKSCCGPIGVPRRWWRLSEILVWLQRFSAPDQVFTTFRGSLKKDTLAPKWREGISRNSPLVFPRLPLRRNPSSATSADDGESRSDALLAPTT